MLFTKYTWHICFCYLASHKTSPLTPSKSAKQAAGLRDFWWGQKRDSDDSGKSHSFLEGLSLMGLNSDFMAFNDDLMGLNAVSLSLGVNDQT